MRPGRGPHPTRNVRLSALLLCWVACVGCAPSDPLPQIRRQIVAGDYRGAIEPLRELLAQRKGDAEVLYLYGYALTGAGEISMAEWSLREAMDDPEWLVRAGTQLVHGALLSRNFPVAIEAANRVLEAEPDNVSMLSMRANAQIHSRLSPEAALEDVARVLELDPENLDVMEPKILSLLALERIDEAGEAIDELGRRIAAAGTEASSQAGWHCATAALFAQESGEAQLAEERFADCVERFPGHQNVIENAVRYYDGRQDYARSLEILRRGQQENPESRELRVVLAERLRQAGQPKQAETLLREAAERERGVLAAAAYIDLAKHYQALEDYAASARAAEMAHERARESGTVLPEVLLEYADALLMAGELDRSLAVADEMTVPAHRLMIQARVAQQDGRPAEALDYFDQAFVLWPDNPFARYYAALAAESIGNFDRAIEDYRSVLRIAPEATDANLRVARLHMAEHRPQLGVYLLRLNAAVQPLSYEGELLSVRLGAQLGRPDLVNSGLTRFRQEFPAQLASAIEQAALGMRDRAGAAAAIRFIRETPTEALELTAPRSADALRTLVRLSHEAGQLSEARPQVEAAVKAHPQIPAFHEIRGLLLELGGSSDAAAAAYREALALDAGNLHALRGLARLAAAGPEAEALATAERVLAHAPKDDEALLLAASALERAGRGPEAEVRLETLLAEDPYHGGAARRLADLQLARGEATPRTLDLAQRAVRFGGGAEALELLARVHEKRGETEQAGQANDRAKALRDQQAG